MTSFYFRGETLFASDIDVKRVARAIRNAHRNPDGSYTMSMDEALELVAHYFGANHAHDMRKQAADPVISGMRREEKDRLVQESAIFTGEAFPKSLPPKFGTEWQKNARRLFELAIQSREPEKLEFLALVGSEGSGKTLLANHMCQLYGGYVVDVELYNEFSFLTKPMRYQPGQVLIYDRPTVSSTVEWSDVSSALQNASIDPAIRTLKRYRELSRSRRPLIPSEERYRGGGMWNVTSGFNQLSNARHWVLNNTQVTMVVSFTNIAEVEEAISSDAQVFTNQGESFKHNWRRVHVVNLDTMTFCTVDGPGMKA